MPVQQKTPFTACVTHAFDLEDGKAFGTSNHDRLFRHLAVPVILVCGGPCTRASVP